jgi:hypothetical protein
MMTKEELFLRKQQLKEAKSFVLVDVNEFLPNASKMRAYTGDFGTITSPTGGEVNFQEIIQDDVIITFGQINIYYEESGTTRIVVPTNKERDIFKIDISSSSSVLFNKPMDVFAFNSFLQSFPLSRMGIFIPKQNSIDAKLTRNQKTAAINGSNITASLSLSGFEI